MSRSTGPLGRGIEEQAVVIQTAQGAVVITGCAHPGIVNVVRRARDLTGEPINLVLGGFHLAGTNREEIAAIVKGLQGLGVRKAAPLHCSGEVARFILGEGFGEDHVAAGVGSHLEIGP